MHGEFLNQRHALSFSQLSLMAFFLLLRYLYRTCRGAFIIFAIQIIFILDCFLRRGPAAHVIGSVNKRPKSAVSWASLHQ
jgi:hypothetical protein